MVKHVFDHGAAVAVESSRIADLTSEVDLDKRVPSCPDWCVRELVLHVGEVQRFWAENVRSARPDEPWNGERVAPASDADLGRWLREGTAHLVTALDDAGNDSPCWTWWGDPFSSGAVARHQVQEAAVHRWDAESALSMPMPIERSVADDGVGDFLSVMLGRGAEHLPGSVRLAASDTGTDWRVGPDDGGVGATIRAPASDLVLLLYRRIPTSAVVIEGDRRVAEALVGAAGTE
jgi:uncharacterized protein (TIGR03083 family)